MRFDRWSSPRALIAASLLAGVTFQLLVGVSYVSAFLDPVGQSAGVPVAVVNLDEGEHGEAFATALAAYDGVVRFTPMPTREAALGALERKASSGALVIPANFSAALASMGTQTPQAALVEVFENPGASATGNLVARRAMDEAVSRLRAQVQARFLEEGTQGAVGVGVLSTAQARVLTDPVKVQVTVVNPIPPQGASGVAPTYLTMAAWMGGYFGAAALERFREQARLTTGRRVALVAGAALAQGALTVGAMGVVGLSMPDAWRLLVILVVGTWMAYAVVGFLMDVVGLAGVVPAFALLAVGLPASGGIYPVEMLAPSFRAVHAVNPFAWLVEALQTVLYAPLADDFAVHAWRLAGVAAAASGLSLAWAAVKSRGSRDRVST